MKKLAHSSKLLMSGLVVAVAFLLFQTTKIKAAAAHVVISQIETNTSSNDEFVELYNPTSLAVDLTGWKLWRENSSGTAGNLIASMSGTIASHSYFLIGSSLYTGTVVKDATYTNNSNNLTNNYAVLISDNLGVVIDKVGMGTNLDFETAAAPNPPALGSIQRKLDDTNGHGLDTDNNANDFEVLDVASPRNSTSVVTTSTGTPTPTPTDNPIPTSSPTETIQPTDTQTPSPTQTPVVSPTPTPVETGTPDPTEKPRDQREKDKHHEDSKEHDREGRVWSHHFVSGHKSYPSVNNHWFTRDFRDISCHRD